MSPFQDGGLLFDATTKKTLKLYVFVTFIFYIIEIER